MPDENDLRRLLSETTDAPHTLDAAKIVAHSRRRRLPRQLAAGAVGVLAIAGVGVLAVNVSTLQNPAYTSADQSTMSDSVPESDSELEAIKRGGADTLNACGAPIALVDPSRYGLEVAVEAPPSAMLETGSVEGVVRLTNTSTEPVDGLTVIPPTLTMSSDNLVVAQGMATPLAGDAELALQPGDSVEYAMTLSLVSCIDGETLPPGSYDVSAAVDFTRSEPDADGPDLVTGPLTSIALN